ncbi:coenzyme F420-0:L-glutamate ligase [Nocardioides sp. B-3]|uniref:coenzyme F420-0:L-glutamate ligase n=1 Tax=Nocardioides sp. B-3 TaxID=2895565 RepID=UPI002152EE44|nr:coenzyme F420-0:L-glutamate ligase [Nocardioides sp. B-3]UUZ59035.1 coenzyme F420-0:L-glutamate ligase [Nocardioides sp. B-3]
MPDHVHGFAVHGMPKVVPGDDLAGQIWACITAGSAGVNTLRSGDVVVVTSKIVSKAEGRHPAAADRSAAIDAETVRLVAARGDTRIVETRHGFVLAAAGVDNSNVESGLVLLLPIDPDESARQIRRELRRLSGADVAVLVTDTAGRPWRNGLVDLAIGAAGLEVLIDCRSRVDAYGNELSLTITAAADEIAAFAELIAGKTAQIPVVVVRGLHHLVTLDDGPVPPRWSDRRTRTCSGWARMRRSNSGGPARPTAPTAR